MNEELASKGETSAPTLDPMGGAYELIIKLLPLVTIFRDSVSEARLFIVNRLIGYFFSIVPERPSGVPATTKSNKRRDAKRSL